MAITQQLILTVPPEDGARAASFGLSMAHMAYRIGRGGRLFRVQSPQPPRGGLMSLDAAGFDGQGNPTQLCQQIIRECSARGYEGVLCDLEGEPTPFLENAVRRLGQLTAQRGWPLYVTEDYGGVTEHCQVLIPSLLSAGTLEERLITALTRWGGGRVVLAAQRAAEDFTLPSSAGEGAHLTRTELARLVKRFSPAIYFDHGLCAHHFTYMERSVAHFVLFDDSGSLRRKLALAGELGICRAVLAFPEVEDILPQLLGRP